MPRPEIRAKCTFVSVFNGNERVYFSGISVKYATLLVIMLVMLIVLGVCTKEVVRKSAPPRSKIPYPLSSRALTARSLAF